MRAVGWIRVLETSGLISALPVHFKQWFGGSKITSWLAWDNDVRVGGLMVIVNLGAYRDRLFYTLIESTLFDICRFCRFGYFCFEKTLCWSPAATCFHHKTRSVFTQQTSHTWVWTGMCAPFSIRQRKILRLVPKCTINFPTGHRYYYVSLTLFDDWSP